MSSTNPIPGDLTLLLQKWEEGDAEALNEAFPRLISELRGLARGYLAREAGVRTLQPTELVHETYLRLLESRVGRIENRSQFFAFAARLMRQILVDQARIRCAAKRGGGLAKVELQEALGVESEMRMDPERLLTLHLALERLERIDGRQHQIAELRYFVGLTMSEIAQVLEISKATVERQWEAARRWLALEIGAGLSKTQS